MFSSSIAGFPALRKHNSHIVYVCFLVGAAAPRYHYHVKKFVRISGGPALPARVRRGSFHKGDTGAMNWLRKFMYGRYGGDQLSMFLVGVYLALYVLSGLTRFAPLSWLATLVLVYAFYRSLSRRTDRRRAENARFMEYAGPVIRWFRLRRTIRRDKDHCYFKCPNCGQRLRVPRGKGKITVTCRNCGVSFEEKS